MRSPCIFAPKTVSLGLRRLLAMMQTDQIKLVLGSIGDVGMVGPLPLRSPQSGQRSTVSPARVANGRKKRQGGRSALPRILLAGIRDRSVAPEGDSARSTQRAPQGVKAVEPAGHGENRGPVAGGERGVDRTDDLSRAQRLGNRARIEQRRNPHLIQLC